MAASADAIITARLRPEFFAERGLVSANRTLLVAVLAVFVLVGFGFRVANLSADGLSEDELNKLQAVADYREHGLTSANGEHPLLMKALQTASLVLADKWNHISWLGNHREASPEAALRLPGAVFGALTSILIYLVAAELFGAEVGLIAAALWAFDPTAIGLNRIAKEDTFLLFFFLLANVFWLRGQRVAESDPHARPEKYYWATAAIFGAMMASKYVPQLIAISFAYYWIFQQIPQTRWRLGKKRLLVCLAIMLAVFVALNPTILFPATWKQMGLFAGQKLIGHDGYEFMGKLYSHRMTDWLKGIPWYFYHVLVAVKLPVLTVVAFIVGLPLLFRRKVGDGRHFIVLWLFLWMMTFSFAGGKFTRYFTVALPAVLITAAIGLQFVASWLNQKLAPLLSAEWPKIFLHAALVILVVGGSMRAAALSSPHFRLYTNALGGGLAKAGYYFPHDEFYDGSMRDAVFEIARRARPSAQVSSESPMLAAYYAQRVGRQDLTCVLLSDPAALRQLGEGDFVIIARGRRYFSNEAIITTLEQSSTPAFRISMGNVPSASIYVLDRKSLEAVNDAARHLPPLASSTHPLLPGSQPSRAQ
ncbi:MAG TPA: glycosyltransferase family 39 protein [Pyrinomonadaceae bacterium]|nr:glycosyltransferase family 39 protein [Pyrinomonadaceae bacterium]